MANLKDLSRQGREVRVPLGDEVIVCQARSHFLTVKQQRELSALEGDTADLGQVARLVPLLVQSWDLLDAPEGTPVPLDPETLIELVPIDILSAVLQAVTEQVLPNSTPPSPASSET